MPTRLANLCLPVMINRGIVVEHFDRYAGLMENQPWFYDWVLAVWERYAIPFEAEICDVGCGTGTLLTKLHTRGYRDLSGTDFAPGCVAVTRQALPSVHVFLHDIELAPLPRKFDVITATTVIDFVTEPESAIRNIVATLRPGGLAFITVRNRQAYWPLYYLRGLAEVIPNERLRHWFLWFTTPLALRRRNWPGERIYSLAESPRLLHAGGLRRWPNTDSSGCPCFGFLRFPTG